MASIRNYLSLVKFSHTVFALPFAIIGFFLGIRESGIAFLKGTEGIRLFLLVLLCMVFARSAAMAFNRWADHYFDSQNVRTKIREIPSGIITRKNAMIFVAINILLFILTTFFINRICFFLSPVALLVILGYSYTKRFTPLCHLVLGLGLSLAPIGAFLSVTGEFQVLPILFSLTVLFWVSGFDIIYALQDETFDRANNLRSIPVLLGTRKALFFSRILHILAAALILYAGYYGDFRTWYWAGAAIFIILLIYQHRLVKPDDLSRVNLAFATTNGIASVLFACFFLLEYFF